MNNELAFEAKDKKLREILFGNINCSLKIPRYQRPYAWNEEEINEFWNDIISTDQSYFLGSFIFNKEHEKKGIIEVIDGQQRLLTTTIFIAALRNHALNLKDVKIASILQRQCIAFEDEEGNETFRVIPGDTTVSYFVEFIQKQENSIQDSICNTKEETRIKNNYQILFDKIKNQLDQFDTKEKKIEQLKELRKKVGDLIVIDIQIKSEEVAYEIFETVNARGVELSVSDLLKNLIFSKIKDTEGKDTAKALWGEIESNIEKTGNDLKKFIRYYWISKHAFVTEKKLYTSIKREITDWQKFINDLHVASTWFNTMLEGSEDDFNHIKNGNKVYRSLFAIKIMNVSQCYVFLLAILKNIKNLKTDPTNIIQTIEKFTYQYNAICKLPGNRIEKIYSKYSRELEELLENDNSNKNISGRIQSTFAGLKKELLEHLPSSEVFMENYNDLSYDKSQKSRLLIKYSLEEINKHSSTQEHKLDFNQVNIEHILPQEPKKWDLTKKEIKDYVDKIGNLTLLSKKLNSTVGNDILSKKLPELEKSEIKITKQLVSTIKEKQKWDKVLIEERQKQLAKISYETIWKIN